MLGCDLDFAGGFSGDKVGFVSGSVYVTSGCPEGGAASVHALSSHASAGVVSGSGFLTSVGPEFFAASHRAEACLSVGNTSGFPEGGAFLSHVVGSLALVALALGSLSGYGTSGLPEGGAASGESVACLSVGNTSGFPEGSAAVHRGGTQAFVAGDLDVGGSVVSTSGSPEFVAAVHAFG